MIKSPPVFTLVIKYTEPGVRAAVHYTWREIIGWKSILGWGLVVLGTVIAYINGIDTFMAGLFLGWLSLIAIFAFATYQYSLRAALRRFRQMEKSEVILELFEEGITVTTSKSSATMAWEIVVKLVKFPTYWLLFYTPTTCLSFYLTDLPTEAQAYIQQKIGPGKIHN